MSREQRLQRRFPRHFGPRFLEFAVAWGDLWHAVRNEWRPKLRRFYRLWP